jgi:hypothetical protein
MERGLSALRGCAAAIAWRVALLGTALSIVGTAGGIGCAPRILWTCDFDASESRPLADPTSTPDDAGHLPSGECQSTCGPPATSCTYTMLDGGPGAICPVCTF